MVPETVQSNDAPQALEEYWDDLLAFIDERHVVPVVGAELLEVDGPAGRVPLYDAVARRLLHRFGLVAAPLSGPAEAPDSPVLRPHHELNDAVCALSRRGRRVQDLYRPIHEELKAVLGAQGSPVPGAVAKLAAISSFDLYVTTTIDDILVQALNATRFGGAAETEIIEYAPNLSSDRTRDIPEVRSSGYTAVFQVFGRSSPFPQFAIHDEDLLEFVYGLQGGRGPTPERMLGLVRSRNLLLVGCNFADWLSRFFIRLANQNRLFSDRAKREFLVDAAASSDGALTVFLERFSQNTRIFPGSAAAFVDTLHERWLARQPAKAVAPALTTAGAGARRSHIFISYASEDRASVRALVEDIQAIGGDIVWFDRHDLSAGDAWKNQILTAIRCCNLFVPIISAATEGRAEGFFRREWQEAVERDLGIQGRTFIVPVSVDEQYAGDPARYQLIPDRFRQYHFGAAPRGRLSPALRDTLVQTIRALRRNDTP